MNSYRPGFDCLRVLAALAVIWLHVSSGVATTRPDLASSGWWTGNVADAFSRWCVPVFVMISGALLLEQPGNAAPLPFYRKRAWRLLPPLLFWSAVYLLYRSYSETSFSGSVAVRSVLAGAPYFHLWYLCMIVGLYLFTPFLTVLVTALQRDALWLLIGLCFCLTSVHWLLERQPGTLWLSAVYYVGYFLAGYALSRPGMVLSDRFLVAAFLFAGLAVAGGTALLLPWIGPRSWNLMYHYLNPLVAVMAFSIFLWVVQRQDFPPALLRWVNRLAPLSLGIYLLHPLWMRVLDALAITGFLWHPLFGIPAMTLSAFVLSALAAAVLRRIPFLRHTL